MHTHYSLSFNLFHIHPSTHQVWLDLPPKYNLNLSPFPLSMAIMPIQVTFTYCQDCYKKQFLIALLHQFISLLLTDLGHFMSLLHKLLQQLQLLTRSQSSPSCSSVSPNLTPPSPLPTILQSQWPPMYHAFFAFTITSTRRLPGPSRAGSFLSLGFILKVPF